jgi:hypothetical protein
VAKNITLYLCGEEKLAKDLQKIQLFYFTRKILISSCPGERGAVAIASA